MRITSVFSLVVSLFLLACSGSGGDDSPPSASQAVLVNAGADTQINEQETLVLSGVASGGVPPYTFEWQGPSELNIEQAEQSAADASLTAPSVIENTSYTLTLIATDSEGKSGRKSMTLSVLPINAMPVAQISANTIEPYPALAYPVTAKIVLDGMASFDEDAPENMPQIAAYSWQQLAGSDLLGDAAKDQAKLEFMAPVIRAAMQIDIMLTVTDQEGAQSSAQISLNLLGEEGTLPSVALESGQAVFAGELIALESVVSSLAPSAAPFRFEWQHDYSEPLFIAEPNLPSSYAVAPNVRQMKEIEFTLSATDSFDNLSKETVLVSVYPQKKSEINDTGVIFNTDDRVKSARYVPNFEGQDAQYGQDRIQASGVLDKIGFGQNGFDFTPLNENGDPIDQTGSDMQCVRDNTTGLVWETKSLDAGSIRASQNLFTWYQEENNGNNAGALNLESQSCNLSGQACNTQAYIDALNSQGYCGFFDWRLPNHSELQSIVNYGRDAAPVIDTQFFQYTDAGRTSDIWYWTSQPNADGVSDDSAQSAWAIDFATGVDSFLSKRSERHVRLVRAGRVTE